VYVLFSLTEVIGVDVNSGSSLVGVMFMVTVAILELSVPSLTWYLKVSVPLVSALGE